MDIPNWIWKPKNKSVQVQGQKMNLSAQAERAKSLLYLFVLLKLSVRLAKLTRWVRMICFIRFTDSNANLFPDSPWNDVLPALWSSLSPVLLTHTSNHHKAHSCLLKSYGGWKFETIRLSDVRGFLFHIIILTESSEQNERHWLKSSGLWLTIGSLLEAIQDTKKSQRILGR